MINVKLALGLGMGMDGTRMSLMILICTDLRYQYSN
jgi:hypothetical protein